MIINNLNKLKKNYMKSLKKSRMNLIVNSHFLLKKQFKSFVKDNGNVSNLVNKQRALITIN